jgi:LysM repeat protein
MNIIGIKLADGSFYPVFEEEETGKKVLDLTTAHDNQATVMVDLYRSKSNTMEDAEYVDTLQIDHLVAHPNGEPDISFTISLDENNKLSAEINDPESGGHSDTTITLVSRTPEERMKIDNFDVVPSSDTITDNSEEKNTADAVSSGGLLVAASKMNASENGDDDNAKETYTDTLSFAKNELNKAESEEKKEQQKDSEKSAPVIEETTFDMPDFSAAEVTEPADNAVDFSLPDFDDNGNVSKIDEPDTITETENDEEIPLVKDSTPSHGINFAGLFDKETEQGKTSMHETDTLKKKTKVPVLICVICAIICIIATVLILFVVPSKYNLIPSRNTKNTVGSNTPVPIVQELPKEESVPEPPQPVSETAAPADNTVAVAPAAAVVPEPPPAPKEKPADITYKIKWGDTLWDIADAYYRNPWRYHRIAKYNHIKNPDYIISGRTLKLPAE